jgi:mannose/fructose/N-acetylgalactosamine-specific phosphotransferase system component IIC
MADRSGNGLLVAGMILTVVGFCIVLIKVWHVPAYWVPLMAGLALIVMGLIRRLVSGGSREDRR